MVLIESKTVGVLSAATDNSTSFLTLKEFLIGLCNLSIMHLS